MPAVSLPQCLKLLCCQFVRNRCSDTMATSSNSSSTSWFMLPPRLVQPINLSLSNLALHSNPRPGFCCSFHIGTPEMQPLQTAVTCHTPIIFINGVTASCTVPHRIILASVSTTCNADNTAESQYCRTCGDTCSYTLYCSMQQSLSPLPDVICGR